MEGAKWQSHKLLVIWSLLSTLVWFASSGGRMYPAEDKWVQTQHSYVITLHFRRNCMWSNLLKIVHLYGSKTFSKLLDYQKLQMKNSRYNHPFSLQSLICLFPLQPPSEAQPPHSSSLSLLVGLLLDVCHTVLLTLSASFPQSQEYSC